MAGKGLSVTLVLLVLVLLSETGCNREPPETNSPPAVSRKLSQVITWRGEDSGYRARTEVYDDETWRDVLIARYAETEQTNAESRGKEEVGR